LSKKHIAYAEAHDFLNSRTGIEHCCEERVIATTVNSVPINCGEHSVNLVKFEILDGTGSRALERNR